MAIVFIDLETTGLDPRKDKVLEIAVIIVDDAFQEKARYSAVTAQASTIPLGTLDPVVQKMHVENGLWLESALKRPSSSDLQVIDQALAQKIQDACFEDVAMSQRFNIPNPNGDHYEEYRKRMPLLGGSTVNFDRGFLEVHFPCTNAMLHYRNVDVTSINEFARRAFPAVYEARLTSSGVAHRAMPDIEYSLAIARYYAGALAVATVAGESAIAETVDPTPASNAPVDAPKEWYVHYRSGKTKHVSGPCALVDVAEAFSAALAIEGATAVTVDRTP